MMIDEMNDKWHEKIVVLGKREKESDYNEFITLIDNLDNYSLNTIRTLLKTYHDEPSDFGTQECVETSLNLAKQEDVLLAFLEELPRLVKEAPEWTLCFVCRILQYKIDILIDIIKDISTHKKKLLLDTLYKDEDFDKEFENCKKIKSFLEQNIKE